MTASGEKTGRSGELQKKLTEAAMFRPDREESRELAEDFGKIRERIDRVVTSPIAAGEPTKGPIHTADYRVKPARETAGPRPDQPAEGDNPLLGQAAKYEAPYLAVPRVVGEAE